MSVALIVAAYVVGLWLVLPAAMRECARVMERDRKIRPVVRHHRSQQAVAPAAFASTVDPADGLGGDHLISLACRECGSREVPPVESVPSPPLQYRDLGIVEVGNEFVLTSTCRACCSPLTSRELSRETVLFLRCMGARDLSALVDEFLETL